MPIIKGEQKRFAYLPQTAIKSIVGWVCERETERHVETRTQRDRKQKYIPL